jgi:hypothetical protein
MSMVCPQCHETHDKLQQCPKCKVRLLYQAPLQPAAPPRDDGEDESWQRAPWVKVLVALILVQGLWYGLQNLTMAGFSLSGDDAPESVWRTLGGIILSQTLQGLCLIGGGLLAGAGQRSGAVYGCFLGLANGAITLIAQRNDLQAIAPRQAVIYALPLVHTVLGALGGHIGALIWRPTPMLSLGDTTITPAPQSVPLFSIHFLAGPLYLGRICIGIVIVVVGVGWSSAILQSMVEFSQGAITVRTSLQAKLVSWEIAALAALLGSGYAGANTFNGLKQGMVVGVAAAIIVTVIQLSGPNVVVEALALNVGSILLLTVAGGWFGAQLFPPVLQRRRRLSPY